jgi:hypothetical protein
VTCLRCKTPSTCSWNGCSPGTQPAEAGQTCQFCNGAGNIDGDPCKPCDRTGRVQDWPINQERRRDGLFPITQAQHVAGGVALLKSATELIEAIGRHNDGMAQSVAERQRAFKASMKAAGYVKLEAWVTKDQRDKFRQLGGDEWLRKRIDSARDPAKSPQNPATTEGC